MSRGKLLYEPGGIVLYSRDDGWILRTEIGWDETKSAEVLDLRKLGQWYPGADPLGLTHDPSSRRDVSNLDLIEIDDVFTRNYASRRRPLLIIHRDGAEVLREPPPEPQLVISTETAAAPIRRGRKPERGLLGNRAGMGMLAIAVMSLASVLGTNLLQRTQFWHYVGLGVICAGLLLTAALAVAMLYESHRFRTRRRSNRCIECGYSRANLAQHAPCPECGAGHWYQ